MNKQESLMKLKKTCEKCTKCKLSETRTNVVFGKGNINAKILFIGEAPGEKEDLSGLPFVGMAGKNLDKELNKINITLDDCFIVNILKCRPPKNRNPSKEEIKICTQYLLQQIEIISPEIICTLGNYSTKFILSGCDIKKIKEIKGITELHGIIHYIEINKRKYKVIPMFHPAAILYRRKLKEEFENDFNIIKEELK